MYKLKIFYLLLLPMLLFSFDSFAADSQRRPIPTRSEVSENMKN